MSNHLLVEVLISSNRLSVLVNDFLSAIDFFRLSNEVLISSNHLFVLVMEFLMRFDFEYLSYDIGNGFPISNEFLVA